jgi:hypothetical protein
MAPEATTPPGNALAPSRILALAAEALENETESEVCLNDAHQAVALVGHACMIAVGFRLVGLGEEGTIGKR